MNSGEQFSRDSIEFRLMLLHSYTQDQAMCFAFAHMTDRLIEANALQISGRENGNAQTYASTMENRRDTLIKLLLPEQESKTKSKATDIDRQKYLNALGSAPYASLGSIIKAVRNLNETVTRLNNKIPKE